MNLGGGGECPLLLVGIEPERIDGIGMVSEVRDELLAAATELRGWRDRGGTFREAREATGLRRSAALGRLPPIGDD